MMNPGQTPPRPPGSRPAGPFQGAVPFLRALIAAEPDALRAWLAVHQLDADAIAWLRHQGLDPWVFDQLRRGGLLALLPTDVAGSFRVDYYATAAYHTLLSAALRELLVELSPTGIHPIVLKGMALSSTLYLTPAARPTSDLDLLIEQAQVPVARQALLKLGYQDVFGLEPEDHVAFSNHLHVQRESAGGLTVAIEAHWHLVHDPGYVRHMDADLLRARAQPADLSGCSTLVLDPTDQLLHACAHLLLHHNQHPRLIWLLDMRLLVERYGPIWDWAALLARAHAMHLAAALYYWLGQAELWFGAFLPASVRQSLAAAQPAEDEARYLAAAQTGDLRVWENYWQRASGTLGLRQKLAYVRETFFPPWAYMQHRYGARSRWLAPFYYGWRFIRAGLVAFRQSG